MQRRRKILFWFVLLGIPTAALLAYFTIPVRTEVTMPLAEVRTALKKLYPQHNFKTVTDNGTHFHGDIRKIQEHPAYVGWSEPGWDLDVDYRIPSANAFEVEISNYSKLQSRKTIIRAEASTESSTRILVTTDHQDGLLKFDHPNPSFARARLREIRAFFDKTRP
jgi:hypothetical protein